MPTDSRRLAQTIARLNRRLRQERQSELSAGQLSVMGSILSLKQPSPSQLAAVEKISGPAMTRTLNCLEEAGYIVRVPHPHDGRQVQIEISERGQEALADERQRRDAWLDERLKCLTTEQRTHLRATITIFENLLEDEE
ncbi:MAG: MarR family transcriptional regulator [Actinomycetales bacterium]|nr:MarR family transcriptional regulator [Actinomycetales bacterium]